MSRLLPQYVERADNQSLVTPAVLTNALCYFFPLRSDVGAQQRIVDTFLNFPSQGQCQYRAFFPQVFFMFGNYAGLRSEGYPDRGRGFYPYQEAGIWIPVISVDERGLVPKGTQIKMFPFYMFVDCSQALVAGREEQGWPKELAVLKVPKDVDSALHFSVAPRVLCTFSPSSAGTTKRLIHLQHVPKSGSTFAGAAYAELNAAKKGIENFLFGDGITVTVPTPELVLSVAKIPLSGLTFAFLKQFRDAEIPIHACYQAGVEAHLRPSHFRGAGILSGSYDMTLLEAASHPIADELALDPRGFCAMRGFWWRGDITLDSGKVLWELP